MTLVNMWVGAVTTSSARVVTKVTDGPVRLAVADNSGLSGPEFYGPEPVDGNGVASITATGLDQDTPYWYAIEDNGVLETEVIGEFITDPPLGQPADFTIAMATCAGSNPVTPGVGAVLASDRLSNHPVFSTIRGMQPRRFIHGGDLHYYDLGSDNHGIVGGGSVANYRRSYDDVLLQPNQAELYRRVPLVFAWDDHDYGPNNSDRTHPDKENAAQVYRERVPHYPLVTGGAIYHPFQIGRILFIVADVRFHRHPNSDPQSPSKTMLGEQQKSWMDSLLATSDAEFLVWTQGDRWLPAAVDDAWDSFADERDELVQMFSDRGWLDRMLILQGDAHHLGMSSGATNPYGGFPVYQFSPLDSGTSTGRPENWDASNGTHSNRGQFGTVRFRDLGDRIEITARGWAGSNLLATHQWSVTVETPDDPDVPDPEPTPPATAGVIRTRVRWYGADLVTGQLIAPLHDITGTVSRKLGASTSASLTVPIPRSGPGAVPLSIVLQATEPGRTMVVAVVNEVPAWGGIVLVRDGGTGATLSLATITIEGYLDRRYVRDHRWTGADEATIVRGLLGDAQIEGVGLSVDAPPTGRLRSREYFDQDDATVLSRLQELMRVTDGPEWTIDLDWTDDTHTAVAKVFRLRPRIGTRASQPTAVFRTTAASVFGSRGASEARYTYKEDYSDGRGANHVVATSSGEGEDRPQSAPARATDLLDAGWPRWERRWSPSSSIQNQSVLDEHAAAELARRRNGARTWTFEARWDQYPRLNVDWRMGDDIGWRVFGHRHPAGVVGQGRAIGWDLDMQAGKVKPILLDPASDPETA